MTSFEQERRRLLLSTAAWIGSTVVLTGAKPAKAFQEQTISLKSPLGLTYANHCGGNTDHAALVAELQARLDSDPSARSLTATCPLCGCPVSVSR